MVGASRMARRPSTQVAPAIAPVAAAVTPSTKALILRCLGEAPVVGRGNDDEEIAGQEDADGRDQRAGSPATRYPMKATVMTTGPGVIIATATASRNWRSVEPVEVVDDAAVKERDDGQAAAEDQRRRPRRRTRRSSTAVARDRRGRADRSAPSREAASSAGGGRRGRSARAHQA